MRRSRLVELEFRVEGDLQDVDDEVEENDQCRVKHHHAKHECVVAVEGAFDEVLAKAGNVENGLDDERPGDQPGDGRPHEADDRQQPAAQRVFEDDPQAGGALGLGRADVILREDVEHPAAREPRNVRRVKEPKRHRRQHHVAGKKLVAVESTPAGGREPAKLQRENQHEQRPHHERRQANADHRQRRGDVVDVRVGAQRGDDPEQNAQAKRDAHRKEAELGRHGKFLADDFADSAVRVFERLQRGQVGDVLDELFVQRLVEVELFVQQLANLGGHLFVLVERPARSQAAHEERHRRYAKQNRDGLEQSAEDELEHRVSAWPSGGRRRSLGSLQLEVNMLPRMVVEHVGVPVFDGGVERVHAGVNIDRQNRQLLHQDFLRLLE